MLTRAQHDLCVMLIKAWRAVPCLSNNTLDRTNPVRKHGGGQVFVWVLWMMKIQVHLEAESAQSLQSNEDTPQHTSSKV